MKLLVLSFYFSPDLSAGSFRCRALVDKLVEKGVEVEVVTTLPNRYSSYETEAQEFESSAGLTVRRIPIPQHKSGMIDQTKAFFRFYRKAKELTRHHKYDAVFATSSRLFTAFLGARISKAKAIPLYLDIRDIFVDTLNDVLSAKLSTVMLPVLKQIESYTFSRARRINLVSEGFKSYFQSRFRKTEYRYFTNGIDSEFLEASPKTRVPFTGNTKLKVVYAGNIGEGQGLHKIVPQLASQLKDRIDFTIIGAGGRLDELTSRVAELDNVEIKPPVKRTELLSEYKKADILFLHLNDYEAFKKVLPSKIFEYAALGKPLWAGVSGYAAQFLNENVANCGVFYPGNVNEGINVLSSLQLVEEPRAEFIERYSRQRIMSDMAVDVISFVNEECNAQ
ncbi:glycosyltransferase family 4 protein [Idiomarina baltica]|uniref:Glycosyl transferase, group 1 possible capsular polysaccharide biosynthesis protein n=1 Tax=Idiomarina baltica OS145 TaxID=314276 RepID=A0ABP2CS03_9GAMM|nr:glycosyltransferase family 4 protein [Idiomarina baltica]EAQ31913.1 glycosyl transferase, group 1; possible capsular polysaccharide biosynthesis protein [Idiomarina baltica OS145]